jgi:hypothetical protein
MGQRSARLVALDSQEAGNRAGGGGVNARAVPGGPGPDIVGTALPKIVAELNGFERYAWVTTAYLLAFTSMIPIIGKLGAIYGRK